MCERERERERGGDGMRTSNSGLSWRRYMYQYSTVDPHLSDPDGTEPRPDMRNGRICEQYIFNGQFYLMHSKNPTNIINSMVG